MIVLSDAAFNLAEFAERLWVHGLVLRGGFNFEADDDAPPGPDGGPTKAVLLVGQAGAAAWPHFKKWRRTQPADLANPLDAWSRNVIGRVAEEVGARAVSPSDRPFLPFQRWAMRAEGIKPSPLGILMHPQFGLWHAYRGALLFDRRLDFARPQPPVHLCDSCADKPCLNSCPAEAYSAAGFVHAACVAHAGSEGGTECRTVGCLARYACPYGAPYRYPAEQQAFHMASFLNAG